MTGNDTPEQNAQFVYKTNKMVRVILVAFLILISLWIINASLDLIQDVVETWLLFQQKCPENLPSGSMS